MRTIAISIDEPTLRGIDKVARGRAKSGLRSSRSEVIRHALRDFLARHERRAREMLEWTVWEPNIEQINRDAAALIAEQAEP